MNQQLCTYIGAHCGKADNLCIVRSGMDVDGIRATSSQRILSFSDFSPDIDMSFWNDTQLSVEDIARTTGRILLDTPPLVLSEPLLVRASAATNEENIPLAFTIDKLYAVTDSCRKEV